MKMFYQIDKTNYGLYCLQAAFLYTEIQSRFRGVAVTATGNRLFQIAPDALVECCQILGLRHDNLREDDIKHFTTIEHIACAHKVRPEDVLAVVQLGATLEQAISGIDN